MRPAAYIPAIPADTPADKIGASPGFNSAQGIQGAELSPVQQAEAEREGLCWCGEVADHGDWCQKCDELRHEDIKDQMNEVS